MPPRMSRFVTACQQMLALGVVLAALTPAAAVVSLDVVREAPSGASGGAAGTADARFAAYVRASDKPSAVPTTTVDPTVKEYSLTAPEGARTVPGGLQARTVRGDRAGSARVVSRPEPVVGYGAVGVTWEHGVAVPEAGSDFSVRTRTDGEWSDWTELSYDPAHGPDPDSEEGRHARPGTDELLVGNVDSVQVRAETPAGAVPADMRLAVVDPGRAPRTAVEAPALDTGSMDGATEGTAAVATGDPTGDPTEDPTGDPSGEGDLDLSKAVFTPKPVIYSRAQWGADESMRDKGSLHYYEVHAGFVHHTVNANDYTRAEVPGIIRSIYAYHTRSKGWSDIGYNFLVDRFGRIWEGRAGGVDRPVVGAHTLNYNDYSFAMSAIGNYQIHQPSQAMIEAYGALFAWKLSLHGVDASSTRQRVGPSWFQAINGHRDAGQTACPGIYLYRKIPEIRQLAAAAQRGWAGRDLESDLVADRYPDLVVRRASDDRAVLLPTGGMTSFESPVATDLDAGATARLSPDLTGDGQADVLVEQSDGSWQLRPGASGGTFGVAHGTIGALSGRDLVTPAGDVDGDGRNDLVARRSSDGRLELYRGDGSGGFARKALSSGVSDWIGYDALAATGDVDEDGRADLLARDEAGHLWRFPVTGSTRLDTPVRVPGSWGKYATLTGFGDFTQDGRPDLLVAKKGKKGVIRPGRADGTFGHPLGKITRFKHGADISATDVTGDGAPDVLVRKAGRWSLMPNRGTTEIEQPVVTNVRLRHADLVLNAGDWNRDGFGDVILRTKKKGKLKLRAGDGTGHFAKPATLGKGFRNVRLLAAVGDMTGDGWPDLMGQPAGGAMQIYPGNGDDGLKARYVAHSPISAARQVGTGRWDGDGAPDSIFVNAGRATLYPGNGPGGLTNPQRLGVNLSRYDWVVGVSDVRLTGHADLVVRARKSGYLWLLPGKPGGFGKRQFLSEGGGAYDMAG